MGQIVINLPDETIQAIDGTMHKFGCKNRTSYFMMLHNSLRTSLDLTTEQKFFIKQLCEYRSADTPNVTDFAKHLGWDEAKLKDTISNLVDRKLLDVFDYPSDRYYQDINEAYQAKRVRLNDTGFVVYRSLLVMI